MSDTPRTDAQKRGDFVSIAFARELERENAALREALKVILVPYTDGKKSGLPSGVYVQRFRFEAAEKALA